MPPQRAEIKTITPAYAQELLHCHEQAIASGKFRQRRLNPNTVEQYARDMSAGNWAFTGQGISFDEDGNLLDGQHRIAAIVKANIPIKMLIAWGLPAKVNFRLNTIDTFDVGKKRGLAQQLALDGFTYYTEVSSAARLLILLAKGKGQKGISSPQGVAVAHLLKAEIYSTLHLLAANNAPKSKIRGAIVAPLVLFATVQREESNAFAVDFNEMADLPKGSPVLHFAHFLERRQYARGGTDYQLLTMKALASALYSYTRKAKVEQIRGNDDHLEWLLKVCTPCLNQIRKFTGEVPLK